MHFIGIDIGGTSLRIGLVDASFNVTAIERTSQSEALAGDAIESLCLLIEDYIARHHLYGKVAGLSIALPGTISKDMSTVINLPNVTGFNGQPLQAILQKRFPFPAYLIKDVSSLYSYDVQRFNIKEEGVIIGCYLGTGIGNSISIDGKILTGSNGASGELGHIPLWGCAISCNCGNEGCVETMAGGLKLSQLQKEHFPQTEIGQLFTKHGDHPLLQEFVAILAAAVATEVNILDPHTVILGGGVISMEGFPMAFLEERIRFHARKPLPEANLKFIHSDSANENGIIGAAAYGWKQIKETK
ncbi:MAG: allose kinase [Defluviitaleaceae bacterium]|nr:allose kinase [Defluviitaleaceae bacterium]